MLIELDNSLYQNLLQEAQTNTRKRSHYLLHKSHDESVQRMCIVLLKGTYVRPHLHPQNNKWELLIVLQGAFCVLLFDQNGKVIKRSEISSTHSMQGIEIPENTYHSLIPLSDQAMIMEVKPGPFTPAQPEDFAPWAPAENSDSVSQILTWMQMAQPGDKFEH